MSRSCRRRAWVAAAVAAACGVAFLVPWSVTRDRLPAGAILVPRDAPTLAAAIEQASSHAVIALDARRGPFAGAVVDVPNLVVRSLHGRAVVRGDAGVALQLTADGVTIDGLAVEGDGVGIEIAGAGCRLRDIELLALPQAVRVAGRDNVLQRVRVTGGSLGIDVAGSGHRLTDLDCRDVADTALRLVHVDDVEILTLEIASCATGVRIDDAAGVRVSDVRIRDCGTGIEASEVTRLVVERGAVSQGARGFVLRSTDGARLSGCQFAGVDEAGVLLDGARRTHLSSSSFVDCRTGIRASDGAENALVDNTFRCCGQAVHLQRGIDDLVARSAFHSPDVALRIEDAATTKVMRCTVDGARVGILLARVRDVQVLDARVRRSGTAVASAGADGLSIRRGAVVDCDLGIVFVDGAVDSTASALSVAACKAGIVVADSVRDVFLEGNAVARCDVGVALWRVGYGTHAAQNVVSDCDVGILWTDSIWDQAESVARLGSPLAPRASSSAPLVAQNEFRNSRLADVRNGTKTPLVVGDNLWSHAEPRLDGDVRAPRVAPQVTISLGGVASAADAVLGWLLQWMLLQDDVAVVDLIGLDGPATLCVALTRGDVHAGWGASESARAANVSFWSTPLQSGWSLVAAPAVASPAPGAVVEVATAIPDSVDLAAVEAALARHGLAPIAVQRVATSAEAESLLKFGVVGCAVVDRWEETVTLAGFVALDEVVLDAKTYGLCVGPLDARAAGALRATFDRLAGRLSAGVVRELVGRVRLLRRDPADVAMEFLLREGLIVGAAEGGAR